MHERESRPGSLRWAVGMARLMHPYPVAVVMATSFLLILVAQGHNPGLGFLCRAGAVVFLTQVPVGALNEYLDRETDRITHPHKPIPSGIVTPRDALWLTAASLALFVPLALSFGVAAFAVIGFGTVGGLAYDLWLKPTPIAPLGYVIGFLSLVTWAWLIAGRLTPVFVVVYPPGALLLTAAYLANSYPDIEIDRQLGLRTLTVYLGPTGTLSAMIALFAAVALGNLLAAALTRSLPALALTAVSLIPAALAWLAGRQHPLNRARRTLVFHLISPGIGLLAVGGIAAVSHLT